MLNLDFLDGFSYYKNLILHIIDRKGAENPVDDNLSRLENILDNPLPDEYLMIAFLMNN